MSEETTNQGTEAAKQPINSDEGDKPQAITIFDRADSIAKRLEEAETRLDEKVKSYEKLLARTTLSGKADAGTIIKTPQQLEDERVDNMVKESLKRASWRR